MFEFFTVWVVLLTAVSAKFVNLSLLSTFVFVNGCYLSFVNPTFYRVGGKVVKGWRRFWYVDVLLHLLPLSLNVYRRGFPSDNAFNSAALLLLYLLVSPPVYKTYGVPVHELVTPSVLSQGIYAYLHSVTKSRQTNKNVLY